MKPDFDAIIGAMTLDDMLGQMFMGNICGGEDVDVARAHFEQYRFGALQFSGVFERFVRGGDYLPCGVDRNKPLDGVAAFIHEVKDAGRAITGLPVIMAGDQEGSISNSIFRRRAIAMMPSQMGFGASGFPELAYQAARVSAREVKALGLDMLYGPCLDTLTTASNPEIGARAFSEDPEVVAAMGIAFIRGYAEEGIISNIKHFPGRGAGSTDAHRELESISLDRTDLDALAILPFKRAIAAGADSVMVAHTLYPALEAERLPATLSPRIITGLLREELGFDGLVLPDDLTMFAISQNYGIPQASALCLEAGADMIFMKVAEQYGPSLEAVKASLKAGRLTEARIEQSVRRILTLKWKRGLFEAAPFSRDRVLDTVGCSAHVVVARDAAERAVTLVKNSGTLPLPPRAGTTVLAVVPRDMNVVLSNDSVLSHEMLPAALRRYWPHTEAIVVDEQPTVPQAFEAVGRAKNVDVIVFGIYSAGLSKPLAAVLEEIVALGKPVIVLITNSPYAATQVPAETAAILCTFGISPFAFDAAADVLAGVLAPTGTLPVTLGSLA
jgi:beta-N-acetylhexosaminidase